MERPSQRPGSVWRVRGDRQPHGDDQHAFSLSRRLGRAERRSNGLLYMRARYYSVESRRFLNADPSGFGGGRNWYAFVGGDPTNGMDPTGLFTATRGWGMVKAVGGLLEISVGVTIGAATSWTGIGAVGGGLVALHGLDTFQAGLRQGFYDTETDTGTSLGIQQTGVSRSTANLIDAGIGLASGVSGLPVGVTKVVQISLLTEAGGGRSIFANIQLWETGSKRSTR